MLWIWGEAVIAGHFIVLDFSLGIKRFSVGSNDGGGGHIIYHTLLVFDAILHLICKNASVSLYFIDETA